MTLWMFPVVILYDELVVRCSTIGLPSFSAFLFTALFSLAYGLVASAPGALFPAGKKRETANRIVLILITLFYLIDCFVHFQFKVFYDLQTILNGAGGVVTHYKRDIWLLVTSPAGIRSILLLLLPLLHAVLIPALMKRDRADSPGNRPEAEAVKKLRVVETLSFGKRLAAGVLVLCLGISLALAGAKSRIPYQKEYDYQTACASFGLMTCMRLDAARILTGAGSAESFDMAEAEPAPVPPAAETDEAEEKAEEEKVYAYSALDIDFDRLAEAGGVLAEIDAYAGGLVPSHQNEYTGLFRGKNLIFITAEAFSGYVIDEELTPVLYRMSTKGIRIKEFYQAAGAGTTGGEYQNLFGLFPTAGGASMMRKTDQHNYMTLGTQLDHLGYYGQVFHNGDSGYYNRDRTHVKLGYSDGYMAHWSGLEKLMTEDIIYSDREMARATFPLYADRQPFNIYYMTISGHSPYGRHVNHFSARHWDRVTKTGLPDEVRAFIAANLEVEDMLAWLLDALEEKGIADDTVIVLSPDHFPYGLSYGGLQSLYGGEPDTNFKRDRNGAIIWCGALEDMDPVIVEEPVTSIDLLPTLLNLFGLPWDARLFPGRDILSDALPVAFNAWQDWKTPLGTYTASTGTFTPAEGVKEEDIPEGYVDEMRSIVRNKNIYCQRLTEYDYYYHVFGEEGPWAFVPDHEDTGTDETP